LIQVDSFAADCAALGAAVRGGGGDFERRAQEAFLRARFGYKRFEWAAETFDPSAALAVNGPPVREVEKSGLVHDPTGLQLIETWLFPTVDTTKKKDLAHQVEILLAAAERFRSHFINIDILEGQVFDAAKLEVFRVMTLGITGFDNPLTLHSSTESAAALQSLQEVLGHYPDKSAAAEVSATNAASSVTALGAAVQYLSTHPDFNSFDRAAFITNYANPLSVAISNQETALNVHVIRYNRLLNQDAKTLFDTGAFNINAYSPGPAAFSTPAKVILGQKLFADPSLSLTGTRSCQSCHQPDKAFTDGLVKNTVLTGKDMLPRNTPTLINAALQPAQFYDMRVPTLEDQAVAVVQNNAEMHGDMKLSVQRLWRDSSYRHLFSAAFPHEGRTAIDTFEVMNAIGCYVRSLVALNSRFDEYMRGDHSALTPTEVNGFNLFMGKARCGTCHYMPIFNGAFPPRFVKVDAEVIGVPQDPAGRRIDPDRGRYEVVKDESFLHGFKAPTVRNVARTGPYMHNGVYASLEQVVDFYNKGGGAGLGLKIDNQTLPFNKLDLTEKERADLVAFMKCLDSK
jgi:cytochrome c peroxidase